jgi:hypothetical protein
MKPNSHHRITLEVHKLSNQTKTKANDYKESIVYQQFFTFSDVSPRKVSHPAIVYYQERVAETTAFFLKNGRDIENEIVNSRLICSSKRARTKFFSVIR